MKTIDVRDASSFLTLILFLSIYFFSPEKNDDETNEQQIFTRSKTGAPTFSRLQQQVEIVSLQEMKHPYQSTPLNYFDLGRK